MPFGRRARIRRYAGDDLGLTLGNTRAIVLVALTAVYAAFAMVRLPSPGLDRPLMFVQVTVAVAVEEILFRPLLIPVLQRALPANRRPVLWAVVLAALCWTVVHLPSKPFSQVIGIFIGGLLFGALYAFSGSNVFGFVMHASANAGGAGGLVMFALYLLLALLLRKLPTTPSIEADRGPMPPSRWI